MVWLQVIHEIVILKPAQHLAADDYEILILKPVQRA